MQILVAEDDVASRLLLEHLLRKWGYDVIVVEDGEAALRVLRGERPPSIALLDWMMPKLSGLEVCARIRALEQEPAPYVVLLTAKGQKADIAEGLDRGADDYLVKPFDFDELAARLRVAKRSVTLQRELISSRETIRYQTKHDLSTGALNRATILESLTAHLRTDAVGVAAVLVGIDGYKTLIERHGVGCAEAVVRGIVERARKVAPNALVGRYDVEDLLLVLPSARLDEGIGVAERLRASVAASPLTAGGALLPMTVSCGVTSGDANGTATVEWLLCSMDTALYAAKSDGNRVEVFALGADSLAPAFASHKVA